MSIEPTYKLETPPVAAMTWEEYEPLVLSEWADLLESQSLPESAVREFLERHPSMVPGAMGTIKSSGHYPYSCALLAKTVKALPDLAPSCFSRKPTQRLIPESQG